MRLGVFVKRKSNMADIPLNSVTAGVSQLQKQLSYTAATIIDDDGGGGDGGGGGGGGGVRRRRIVVISWILTSRQLHRATSGR